MTRDVHRVLWGGLLLAGATACEEQAPTSPQAGADTGRDAGTDARGPSLVDAGPTARECDESPVITPDGYMATYGCRFIHHCYKVRVNGDSVEEQQLEVCGADGTCLIRVTHLCERWRLVDDGSMDILVNGRTGEVFTHSRLHGFDLRMDAGADRLPDGRVIDRVPEVLETPVSVRPRPDAGS